MKKIKQKQLKKLRNKKIYFGTIVEDVDDDGFDVKKWKTIKPMWAQVKGLRGKEFYEAMAVQSENTKMFNCLYFKGLTEDIFIKYKDEIYNIDHIDNVNEANFEYEIRAKKVIPSE